MTNFETTWAKLDLNEGFYSHRKDDKGGETYRGISRKFNPKWPGWAIIDSYKNRTGFVDLIEHDHDLNMLVKEFYHDFWKHLHCDDFDSQEIADQLFDIAVNSGEGTAVEFLQIALNALNSNQKLWPDLVIDGVIGAKTLWSIEQAQKRWHLVAKMMAGLRIAYYAKLMREDPSQEVFAAGWLERVTLTPDPSPSKGRGEEPSASAGAPKDDPYNFV